MTSCLIMTRPRPLISRGRPSSSNAVRAFLAGPKRSPKRLIHALSRFKMFELVIYASTLLCFYITSQVGDVDAVTSFMFTSEHLSINTVTDACTTSNGSAPPRRMLLHISKECAPLVSFGGVGQVVGELARPQTKVFSTAAILPNYGFIKNGKPFLEFEYRVGIGKVRGVVHHLKHEDVVYFLIGPPSNIKQLWEVGRIEDVYMQPNMGFRKAKAYTTDLYFSFVASKVALFVSARLRTSCQCSTVVHAHGGSNAPVLWFLRHSRLEIPSIYTIHDYNREPSITYPIRSISVFSRSVTTKQGFVRLCDKYDTLSIRQKRIIHRKRLNAADFAWCADIITTVSKGMIKELSIANEHYTDLLTTLAKQSRLFVVHNWLPSYSWTRAREAVSIKRPLDDKIKNKENLFTSFRRFLIKTGDHDVEWKDCVVVWIGRFELNKGIMLLPAIHEASCDAQCSFVVFGHATHTRSERLFEKVYRIMKRNSQCAFFVFKDRASQKVSERVVRAAADVLIVPSYSEAYGFVAAEALAYGSLPVVSFIGGLPEIIRPLNDSLESPGDSWTGVSFQIYEDSLDLSAKAVKSALHSAITTIRGLSLPSRKIALQRQIDSTPRAGTIGIDGVDARKVYNELVREICTKYSHNGSQNAGRI